MTLRRCTPWALALSLAACQFADAGLSPIPDDAPVAADAAFDGAVDDPAIDAGAIDAAVDAGTAIDAGAAIDARLPIDARPDAAPPVIVDDVAHVPDDGEFAGTGDLTLSSSARIDTSSLTIDDAPPAAGILFDVWRQDGGGPDLAVLHVRRLDVVAGARVRVTGRRPLVVIAGSDLVIAGVVDAGARRSEPGPGGQAAGAGPGAGGAGRSAELGDTGGGGGGHGGTGASGGAAGGSKPCCAVS